MQHAARGAHGLIDGVCAASREHSGCTRGCGGALPVQARHAPPSCCVEWIGAHLNVDGGDGRSEERRDDVHASSMRVETALGTRPGSRGSVDDACCPPPRLWS